MATAKDVKPMEITTDGDTVTIVFDLRSDLGPSKSGDSTIVASTRGNMLLSGGVKLGLTAYRPNA